MPCMSPMMGERGCLGGNGPKVYGPGQVCIFKLNPVRVHSLSYTVENVNVICISSD